MQEFRLGDKVWSYSLQEWGEVRAMDDKSNYPLTVYFKSVGTRNYTSDGRFHSMYKAPDLFHGKVTITPPPTPLPDIPVDTKMLVWDDGEDYKYKRHFAKWSGGKCYCWSSGHTSFTADDYEDVTPWDNWEIVELTSDGRKRNNDRAPELFRQS